MNKALKITAANTSAIIIMVLQKKANLDKIAFNRPDFADIKIKQKWVTGSLILCVIKDAMQENPSSEKRNSALKRKKIRSDLTTLILTKNSSLNPSRMMNETA